MEEWTFFYKDEPFFQDRQESQMAQLMSMVANLGGGKTQPKDFLISHHEHEKTEVKKEIASNEEVLSVFERFI